MIRRTPGRAGPAAVLFLFLLAAGCSKTAEQTVDPQPFKTAIARYLDQNNMAMALKEIKEGPVVEGSTARLKASLTHATMGGPSVTWEFRFEKGPDGAWKAVSHKQ